MSRRKQTLEVRSTNDWLIEIDDNGILVEAEMEGGEKPPVASSSKGPSSITSASSSNSIPSSN
jgi:hypothetical protein